MNRIRTLLLILIITIPAFISLLNNSYFTMHDDQHIARLYLLDQGIKQGEFYPRWVDQLGFGYGYPLLNFYPPLTYYIGEVYHLLGLSYIWSIKMVFITGFIIGALGIFLLARKYLDTVYAYLAAVLYTLFSYHAVLIYVRGALAEFFALAVLPFVFLSLVKKNSLMFAVSLAALILTHPLIAFPTLIYIGFFTLFQKTFKETFFGGIIGLGLSAFFWLPSMMEKKFTLVDNILTRELASYKIHFINLNQFWYSPWGYGGSVAGLADGMSFQLGKIYILLVLGGIMLAICNRHKGKEFYFLTGVLIFSLFMTTEYSRFIWERVSYLWYLQFPWRFLAFATIFISLVGAYAVSLGEKFIKDKRVRGAAVVFLTLFVIGINGKYFKPQNLLSTTDAKRTNYEEIAWRISRTSHEFIPKGVQTKKSEFNTTVLDIDPKKISKGTHEIDRGEAKVASLRNKFSLKEFRVESDQTVSFRLNTYHFPGWSAYLNGEKVKISDANKYKLMTVNLKPGKHNLTFKFEDTPIRRIANLISMVTATFLVIRIFFRPQSR